MKWPLQTEQQLIILSNLKSLNTKDSFTIITNKKYLNNFINSYLKRHKKQKKKNQNFAWHMTKINGNETSSSQLNGVVD